MTNLREFACCCLCLAGLSTVRAADPPDKKPADAQPPAAEREFLERFVGAWQGEGKSDGKAVRDTMKFEWALGERFLRFTYQATDGDSYQGEGYVWYNPAQKRYEWWEFNNGRWPVRHHTGRREKDQLILEEVSTERKLRLTFAFAADGSLQMAESFIEGGQLKPYVNVAFQRAAVKK